MKKLWVCVALSLLCIQGIARASSDNRVTVWINGINTEFSDQAPVILNNRTMVPITPVATKMGKKVEWDEKTSTVTVYDDSTELKLIADKNEMLKNGEKVILDATPVIINDRTCLPLRAVAEAFGAQVFWDDSLKEAHIITLDIFEKVEEKVIGDESRIDDGDIIDCGNCYSLDDKYFFAPVTINTYNALKYAQIINQFAKKLPQVNVYSLLVPDSCEIYAPKDFYTGQWQAFEYVYSNLDKKITPIRVTEKLLDHGGEKIYFDTDHHWTHLGSYYAWESFCEEKGFTLPELSEYETDTTAFSGSYISRMPDGKKTENLITSETMIRYLPIFEAEVTVYSDSEMTKKLGKAPLINTKNNSYSCFISGDHPLAVIKSSVGNGRKLALIKESFGNALATWAVNNYEYIYVIDIRGFKGGLLKISEFYEKTKFDDLIIESYPTTVESSDLRGYLAEMVN